MCSLHWGSLTISAGIIHGGWNPDTCIYYEVSPSRFTLLIHIFWPLRDPWQWHNAHQSLYLSIFRWSCDQYASHVHIYGLKRDCWRLTAVETYRKRHVEDNCDKDEQGWWPLEAWCTCTTSCGVSIRFYAFGFDSSPSCQHHVNMAFVVAVLQPHQS